MFCALLLLRFSVLVLIFSLFTLLFIFLKPWISGDRNRILIVNCVSCFVFIIFLFVCLGRVFSSENYLFDMTINVLTGYWYIYIFVSFSFYGYAIVFVVHFGSKNGSGFVLFCFVSFSLWLLSIIAFVVSEYCLFTRNLYADLSWVISVNC